MNDLKDLCLRTNIDTTGRLIQKQDLRLSQKALTDNNLLLVSTGQRQNRKSLIRHFNMDIPDLFVNCRILCFFIKKQTFYIILQRRNRCILANIKSLNQSLALSVLRNKRKTILNLSRNILDFQLFAFIKYISGMLRVKPHKAFKQFTSSGSQKSVNTKNFTFFQVKAHMVKCPAAAFFRKAQIFNLQHLRLLGKINASLKSMVLCILSYHILYDPAKLNIFNCCICNVFSIPEYGNMIADFHNFFQTMRNIYNRNPSLQKLSHDFEKNFNLCC